MLAICYPLVQRTRLENILCTRQSLVALALGSNPRIYDAVLNRKLS